MAPLSVAYYGTIRFVEATEWSVLVRVQEVLMSRCRATRYRFLCVHPLRRYIIVVYLSESFLRRFFNVLRSICDRTLFVSCSLAKFPSARSFRPNCSLILNLLSSASDNGS